MARIRSLKPMFFQHDGLSALDAETHLLAAGLLCYADDYGYFNANPKLVEAFVFPLRNISGTITEKLGSLCRVGYIRLGTGADGRFYGQVINFDKHQRVHNPSASVIKDLEIDWKIPEIFGNDSRKNPSGIRNKEGNKEEEGNTPPNPLKEGERRKRRSKQQILEPYSEAVGNLVNELIAKWPDKQPGDKKPISVDVPKLAERIDELLKNPAITPELIQNSAEMYLAESKQFYRAPQFFFGSGEGDGAHWRTYGRMIYHQQSRAVAQ